MMHKVTDLVGYRFDSSKKSWLGAFFIGAVESGSVEPKGHYELLPLQDIEKRRDVALSVNDMDGVVEYGTAAKAIRETAAGLRATPNDLPTDFTANLFTAQGDDLFKIIDPHSDVDWTEFKLAQKTAHVKAEFVTEGTRVDTVMANGLLETSKIAGKDGGYRVTAQTGEQYLVDRAKFEKLYDETHTPGIYQPKPDPRKVVPVDRNVAFTAPWGEEMRIKSGGVLVHSGKGDVYGIQPEEYKASYNFV